MMRLNLEMHLIFQPKVMSEGGAGLFWYVIGSGAGRMGGMNDEDSWTLGPKETQSMLWTLVNLKDL